jgi:phosphoribosylglycinamide formyltransferase-1
MDTINLAVFASGKGTNAENIAKYFSNHEKIRVTRVLSNKPNAPVLEKAKNMGIERMFFNSRQFKSIHFPDTHLKGIDFVILAGFLWLIPRPVLKAFPKKILNIHPALLPKHGGKGMFGKHVHQAVLDANEKESGITIHLVNKEYDQGEILFQEKCEVMDQDTPQSLAERIHSLEYEHYPKVIEDYVLKFKN